MAKKDKKKKEEIKEVLVVKEGTKNIKSKKEKKGKKEKKDKTEPEVATKTYSTDALNPKKDKKAKKEVADVSPEPTPEPEKEVKKKDKKNKKVVSDQDEDAPTPSSQVNPMKLDCKPESLVYEMERTANQVGGGSVIYFASPQGVVSAKINELESGTIRINWGLDGKRIAKQTLQDKLAAEYTEALASTEAGKIQAKVKKDASKHYLITTDQLEKKYKTEKFLGIMQSFLGKKQMKKMKELATEKKHTGTDLLNMVHDQIPEIPIKDTHNIFERLCN